VVQDNSRSYAVEPKVALTGPVDSVRENVAGHVLSVLSEGLSNAARHSGAKEIRVAVSVTQRQVELVIQDNGCGFDEPAQVSGLANMRHRAEMLGGGCTIRSAPGEGTRITWTAQRL
jgi:signal transduction histidine kinase